MWSYRFASRFGLRLFMVFWLAMLAPSSVLSAPYAAVVMDARSGKVYHARNADTPLHPASLTKMMTLYIAFEAVQNGEITMDTMVRVSRKAAGEEPSKLGLRPGQRIKLRYLVRAAAVRSANDAATAIAEAISGSESAFAARMTRTAKAMGMTRTTFRNAHGLTQSGHLSTARDMSILGRHVIYDYPQYYNLFSRRTADAGIARVAHTNRSFLGSYRGADGIKTGYTRAAGFNLVASAERNGERIIATVFGGSSTASRNAQVAKLLDLGFRAAPRRTALIQPRKPAYGGASGTITIRNSDPNPTPGPRGAATRTVSAAVTRSPRPVHRPAPRDTAPIVARIEEDIEVAVEQVSTARQTNTTPTATAPTPTRTPAPLPSEPRAAEVVTRLSTSNERYWGINIGRHTSQFAARKTLLQTALSEPSTLGGALPKVVQGARGYDANFMGLTREQAELACQRLQARKLSCFMIGPG